MPNRVELATAVAHVGADLAECLADAHQMGVNPPNAMYGLLLDLEVWTRELRGEPPGPTAVLARLVRDHDTTLLTRPHDWPR